MYNNIHYILSVIVTDIHFTDINPFVYSHMILGKPVEVHPQIIYKSYTPIVTICIMLFCRG